VSEPLKVVEERLKELLLKGLDGDSGAYREFLTRLAALLRQFVRRRLFRMRKADHDVEDIVQEALIAIHGRRHTYDGETPVTAWAYGITRYKLIDSLRAANRDADLQPLDDVDGAVDETFRMDARITVQKAIRRLPETLRIPIQLMKLEGLTALETARRTGTSEATVRVNVHRGLKILSRLCGIDRKGSDENR